MAKVSIDVLSLERDISMRQNCQEAGMIGLPYLEMVDGWEFAGGIELQDPCPLHLLAVLLRDCLNLFPFGLLLLRIIWF